MKKIKLLFKGISEIVGTSDIGLLVLVDEEEQRQIVVTCDKYMMRQLLLRMQKKVRTERLLPEVLWQALKADGTDVYEILITHLLEGEYQALLSCQQTLHSIPLRASDAVLLSYISGLPIYIDADLMARQSVAFQPKSKALALPVNVISNEMLSKALEDAIKKENYEQASQLHDELERRKKVNDK